MSVNKGKQLSKNKPNGGRACIFWFPRAGVGTDFGRASVPSLLAGEPLCSRVETVPTPARSSLYINNYLILMIFM